MEHGWELLILQQHASGKVAPPAAASQQGGGLHPSWQQRQLRMHAWQHAYAQPARAASTARASKASKGQSDRAI